MDKSNPFGTFLLDDHEESDSENTIMKLFNPIGRSWCSKPTHYRRLGIGPICPSLFIIGTRPMAREFMACTPINYGKRNIFNVSKKKDSSMTTTMRNLITQNERCEPFSKLIHVLVISHFMNRDEIRSMDLGVSYENNYSLRGVKSHIFRDHNVSQEKPKKSHIRRFTRKNSLVGIGNSMIGLGIPKNKMDQKIPSNMVLIIMDAREDGIMKGDYINIFTHRRDYRYLFKKVEKTCVPILVLMNHNKSEHSNQLYCNDLVDANPRLSGFFESCRFISMYTQFNKIQLNKMFRWLSYIHI
jgi:hypothetical protein